MITPPKGSAGRQRHESQRVERGVPEIGIHAQGDLSAIARDGGGTRASCRIVVGRTTGGQKQPAKHHRQKPHLPALFKLRRAPPLQTPGGLYWPPQLRAMLRGFERPYYYGFKQGHRELLVLRQRNGPACPGNRRSAQSPFMAAKPTNPSPRVAALTARPRRPLHKVEEAPLRDRSQRGCSRERSGPGWLFVEKTGESITAFAPARLARRARVERMGRAGDEPIRAARPPVAASPIVCSGKCAPSARRAPPARDRRPDPI